MGNLYASQKESTSNPCVRILGDITNCTIGNLPINMSPTITINKTAEEIEAKFDTLVSRL